MNKARSLMIYVPVMLMMVLLAATFGGGCAAAEVSAYVSVCDYGAAGDGTTVDTAAIQRAIDAVSDSENAAYGKAVFFPAGTYLLSPADGCIVLRSGVQITGDEGAVLKVKNNAGNYEEIFGAASGSENIGISDITIDQNGANGSGSVSSAYGQAVFRAENCKSITIQNVKCDSYSGMYAFALEGQGTESVTVQDCSFNFVKAKGNGEYDNSAIYICGNNFKVLNNRFYTESAYAAQTAVKAEGVCGDIAGNVTEGFCSGAALVSCSYGEAAAGEKGIAVTGNTFSAANTAISLLPYSGHIMKNISICGNTISLSNADYEKNYCFGIAVLNDDEAWNGSCTDMTISDNTIKMQKQSVKRLSIDEIRCYGIGLSSYGELSRIKAVNNIITNAPLAGIKAGFDEGSNDCRDIELKNNMIVNAGNYPYARGPHRRAAVYLIGALDNVTVEANTIYDDNEVFSGFESIVACGNEFKKVTVKNNSLSSKSGGYYFYIPSTKVNVDTGVQVKQHYAEEMPGDDKLSLSAGDLVYTAEEIYRVTESGTIGSLDGVYANTGKGNNIIHVTDSSGLDIGDYITFSGHEASYRVMHITENTILLSERCSESLIGAAVSFKAPSYKIMQ